MKKWINIKTDNQIDKKVEIHFINKIFEIFQNEKAKKIVLIKKKLFKNIKNETNMLKNVFFYNKI